MGLMDRPVLGSSPWEDSASPGSYRLFPDVCWVDCGERGQERTDPPFRSWKPAGGPLDESLSFPLGPGQVRGGSWGGPALTCPPPPPPSLSLHGHEQLPHAQRPGGLGHSRNCMKQRLVSAALKGRGTQSVGRHWRGGGVWMTAQRDPAEERYGPEGGGRSQGWGKRTQRSQMGRCRKAQASGGSEERLSKIEETQKPRYTEPEAGGRGGHNA